MPKFAQYDSNAAQPSSIVGWYDTDEFPYANLPAATELVLMTDAEWLTRLDAPLLVSKGKLVPPPVPTAAQLAAAAMAQFAANKAAALDAIDQFHAQTVQGLAGNPSQVEKDSWAMKLATAAAVSAKAAISAEGTAFLSALGLIAPATATTAQIAAADTARAAWAVAVQANAAKYAGLVGLADKLRSSAKAAITAAVDQAALDAAIAANKTAAQAAIATLPKV